jgi:hypothetical protein
MVLLHLELQLFCRLVSSRICHVSGLLESLRCGPSSESTDQQSFSVAQEMSGLRVASTAASTRSDLSFIR